MNETKETTMVAAAPDSDQTQHQEATCAGGGEHPLDDTQYPDCEQCPHWPRGRERAEAECQHTCKRNFWTEVLRSVTKIAGIVLAALGLQHIEPQD